MANDIIQNEKMQVEYSNFRYFHIKLPHKYKCSNASVCGYVFTSPYLRCMHELVCCYSYMQSLGCNIQIRYPECGYYGFNINSSIDV